MEKKIILLIMAIIFIFMNACTLFRTNNTAENDADQDIAWIDFSFSQFEYQEQRDVVRNYFEEDFKDIERIYGDKDVKFGVAIEDLNADGQQDIIAVLAHSYYLGAAHDCFLCVYIQNDGAYAYYPISQIALGYDFENDKPRFIEDSKNEKYIGVRNSKDSAYKEFITPQQIRTWDGDGYEIFSERDVG